jgi:hypothetical protein
MKPGPHSRFIGTLIEVHHDRPSPYEKRPGPPDGFTWEGRKYQIIAILQEWHDYRRRGRMAKNMRESHLRAAGGRGSWGVGRDYYRVRTDSGAVFELYYDRAPKGADHPKGAWFLYRQLVDEEPAP